MTTPSDTDRIADPLTCRVRSTPDRLAIVDADGGRTWSYDELDDDVDGLAERLGGLGLAAGDHLGLLLETSVDATRLIHAAWRRGITLVPLNVSQAEPELERQIDRSDLAALVCSPGRFGDASRLADCPVVALGRAIDHADDPRFLSDVSPANSGAADWSPDDTALLLFTSGTTGPPKAVRLTMANLLTSATASAFRLGVLPTDRWLLCLPIYHMGGLAPVLRSTVYGTGLVVQVGFEPAAVAATIRRQDVTGLSLVPTMLDRVLDSGVPLADSVRVVLLGGAPAPDALIERCRRLGVPVHPTYGLTETASQVATATPVQAFDHVGTVGQPLYGTTVTVVDGDGGPLPAGRTGELVVDGPTVSPGYYADPDATDASRCCYGLRTGDRGHLDDDGRLWIDGRLDDVIVTGGENVQPATVSAALMDHPDVADAAIVGLSDPEWGERVVALVVPEGDREPSVDSILGHCRSRLAAFEVPKTLAFADALPRTPSGTVDRTAVRERFEE